MQKSCVLHDRLAQRLGKSRAERIEARAKLGSSFRGTKAHDFEWLQHKYRTLTGSPVPQDVREHFVLVNTWSTDFRYRPGIIEPVDAADFLAAAEAIIRWADGRI